MSPAAGKFGSLGVLAYVIAIVCYGSSPAAVSVVMYAASVVEWYRVVWGEPIEGLSGIGTALNACISKYNTKHWTERSERE